MWQNALNQISRQLIVNKKWQLREKLSQGETLQCPNQSITFFLMEKQML